MPSVPRYSGPQLNEQGFADVRVGSKTAGENFGGGESKSAVAQAVGNLGSTANKMYRHLKDEADTTKVKEGYTNLVNGVKAAREKALAQRGKNALGVDEEAGAMFDRVADEVEANFDTEQREMFKEIRAKERMAFDDTIKKHQGSEILKYQEETDKAVVKTMQNEAVLAYGDPKRFKSMLGTATALIEEQYRKQGQEPDGAIIDFHADTHGGVVQQMLSRGEIGRAQQYLADNEPEIRNAEKLAQLKNSVKSALKENKENMYIMAGNLAEARQPIPPGILNALTPEQKKHLREIQEGGYVVSDRARVVEIKRMVMNPQTMNDFLEVDVTKERLSPKDAEEILNMQREERKKAGSAIDKLGDFRDVDKVLKDALVLRNIDPNPRFSQSEKKRIAEFHDAVGDRMRDHQKRTGKQPSIEDIQKFADEALVKRIKKKRFFGLSKSSEYDFQITPDEISAEDRAGITKALKSVGKEPTEENILKAYKLRFEVEK